jgi:MoaA/NifB/PqqE/SkfB family radical SAM enzyme
VRRCCLVLLTYCPSSCRHCPYRSGPYRGPGYLDPRSAKALFQTVRDFGCRPESIGGGEPLLRPPQLERIGETAGQSGVSIDCVETNAAWSRDEDSAREALQPLRSKGLQALLVSISPFHNKKVPFFKTR